MPTLPFIAIGYKILVFSLDLRHNLGIADNLIFTCGEGKLKVWGTFLPHEIERLC
jgi:hypothetical protein